MNCSGRGMGSKPASLVSQRCGVMLLTRHPCKPCSCPGQKKRKEEQVSPLPPGKVFSMEKGVRKTWQTGRWRESEKESGDAASRQDLRQRCCALILV